MYGWLSVVVKTSRPFICEKERKNKTFKTTTTTTAAEDYAHVSWKWNFSSWLKNKTTWTQLKIQRLNLTPVEHAKGILSCLHTGGENVNLK